jgi:hypothetical protein
MRDPGRAARRLAAAAVIAVALTAAAVVAPAAGPAAAPGSGPGPGPGSGPGSGPGPVDNPAPRFPWSVTLPEGAPIAAGSGEARLEGGAAARPEGPAGSVLGVVGVKPAALVRLDPRALEPLPGRRVVLPYGISGYAWSPDRKLLVLGDSDDDVVHVVDARRMRLVRKVRFGIVARAPQQVAWLGPRRLAVVAGNPGDGAYLLLVDPLAGRVLSRRRLGPAMLTGVVAGDRLVLLRTPVEGIGPARLLVMDAGGGVRAVELGGVRVGTRQPPDWDRPGAYGVSRDAGLAVDPAGGRAFVVAAGSTVAEVDLAGLGVTYRHLRQPASLLRRLAHWLVPPAEAKLAAGTWRAACWLGGGSLAVWGTDARVTGDTPAEYESDTRPSGLKLVDTRTWTVRTLGPGGTGVRWQAGRLLAFGSTWDATAQRERGTGLTVYGPGDQSPRHLLGDRAVFDAHLHGDLVYASVDNGGEQPGHMVVSLSEGRVLRTSRDWLPYLLLGDHDSPC